MGRALPPRQTRKNHPYRNRAAVEIIRALRTTAFVGRDCTNPTFEPNSYPKIQGLSSNQKCKKQSWWANLHNRFSEDE